jgi:hypothetical protein
LTKTAEKSQADGDSLKELKAEAEKVKEQLWYLCHIRDFDRIRNIIESSALTVDPLLAPPGVEPPRAIVNSVASRANSLRTPVWMTFRNWKIRLRYHHPVPP